MLQATGRVQDQPLKPHTYFWAPYAAVSREWQLTFERRTFASLALFNDDVESFCAAVTRYANRLEYVGRLRLTIDLPTYTCDDCGTDEDAATIERNNIGVATGMEAATCSGNLALRYQTRRDPPVSAIVRKLVLGRRFYRAVHPDTLYHLLHICLPSVQEVHLEPWRPLDAVSFDIMERGYPMLTPTAAFAAVEQVLLAAATAAQRMPKLSEFELWNASQRKACRFSVTLPPKASTSEDGRGPNVHLKLSSTWPLEAVLTEEVAAGERRGRRGRSGRQNAVRGGRVARRRTREQQAAAAATEAAARAAEELAQEAKKDARLARREAAEEIAAGRVAWAIDSAREAAVAANDARIASDDVRAAAGRAVGLAATAGEACDVVGEAREAERAADKAASEASEAAEVVAEARRLEQVEEEDLNY
ncbi:MAG: hypothetical protein STHCBS139747_006768 [Sporothrix thermara]